MVDEETGKKSKPKDVAVIQDFGTFVHKTGDTYEGFFEAKKKERTLKMLGSGVYTSAQGDTYTGQWDYDKLSATFPVTISHQDGSKYQGTFKDFQYSGQGIYTYPDESVLEGNFVENCPDGALKLTDPNGHVWLGNAEQGGVWLEPVNHYYELLEVKPDVRERKMKSVRSIAKRSDVKD